MESRLLAGNAFLCQVIGVEGNKLLLGGADIVDRSPVLDIKPYVPFCDGVVGATAPSWVSVRGQREDSSSAEWNAAFKPLKVCSAKLIFFLPADGKGEAQNEPLKLQSVKVPDDAREALASCWRRQRKRSLYGSEEEFVDLVVQVGRERGDLSQQSLSL